ncbi:MAG: redoxin domain-containing protein [Pirellulales bacterium]|nr:redoxin domain-containing protein [Pirellulales bacterium]
MIMPRVSIFVAGLTLAALLSGTASRARAVEASADRPQIGAKIDGLQFKDIRYLKRSLSDLGQHAAYVLVFLNTDCPVAKRYLPKLKALHADFESRDVQLVGVYCSPNDTVMAMAAHALENDLKFPVVKDEDHSVCSALGIERVPQVAVLDGSMQLIYRGRIDDQYRPGGTQAAPSRDDLKLAVDELLAGKQVAVSETPVDGCKVTAPRDPSFEAPITFHKDIAPILQARCQQCHHEGTAAPFGLVSYDDVSTHAEMIAEVVRDGQMPPWYASPSYNKFSNDPAMTQQERDKVAAWVKAGTPEGNPADAPPALQFADTEWRIGEPDLKITMKKPKKVQAEGLIPYDYVVLPYTFPADTYVQAIEILPHNPRVVHHCNMAYIQMGKGLGDFKAGAETFITGYVPGGMPMDLRNDDPSLPRVALRIPAKSSLVLQIHHVTTGKPEESVISVGFKYAKGRVDKTTQHAIIDPRGLEIAPFDPMWGLSGSFKLKNNVTLLGLFTHMHVRGRDMTFTATYPDGRKETLLQIPNYNFEWQLGYLCNNHLPVGATIEAVAHYDNSKFNAYNPDPTRVVPYGDQTIDEMFNGFVFWINDDEQLNLQIDPKTGTVAGEAKPEDQASN